MHFVILKPFVASDLALKAAAAIGIYAVSFGAALAVCEGLERLADRAAARRAAQQLKLNDVDVIDGVEWRVV